jgi:agmatinase
VADRAKIALIGFPFDEYSSYLRGAAEAPPLIREAFKCESSNPWSESGRYLGWEKTFFDAGDIVVASPEEMFSEIERSVGSLLDRGFPVISLGGDHSITYPIMKAYSERHPGLTILHFDAHPDLYDEFQGNRLSHACPFARIMESNLVGRLVQVGIRTMNRHQREQAEKFGVEVIEMKDWHEAAKLSFDSPVYVTIDMDGLDPAFAPGVSHREPGGPTTRQVLEVIQRINAPVVGADIVEFNPKMDPLNMTAMVAAKLMKEVASKMIESLAGTAAQFDKRREQP